MKYNYSIRLRIQFHAVPVGKRKYEEFKTTDFHHRFSLISIKQYDDYIATY